MPRLIRDKNFFCTAKMVRESVTSSSRRVSRIDRPPIAEINDAAHRIEADGIEIIRLGQAVPWFNPPLWALDSFIYGIHDHSMHRYSPDPGLPGVRALLAEHWFRHRGLSLDPECELHITVGASQAFLSALTSIADAGEVVVLSDPYYFDHLYAVQFLDCRPLFISMLETEQGFSYDIDGTINAVKRGARAVVLVNPSNPTATVLSDSDVNRIASVCAESHCFLIIDETYERFVYDHQFSWHPWMDEDIRPWCLTVGSFSKTFGMAGWRLGYLFGPGDLLDQALKVQDSIAICAPVPAQILLSAILKGPVEEWLSVHLRELRRRRSLTRQSLSAPGTFLSWRASDGGFFSFLVYSHTLNSVEMAYEILRQTGVALVPGSSFGLKGENHLRLSYGSSRMDELEIALKRLVEFRPSSLA